MVTKDEDYLTMALFRPPPRPQNDRRCREVLRIRNARALVEEVQSRPHDWLALKNDGAVAPANGQAPVVTAPSSGLSIAEIVNAMEYLKQHDMLHCAKLLHFHIGSQIFRYP